MIDQIELRREELQVLCRRFHVRRLDLFGSAARGDFDPEHSDFDFVVEFDRSAPQHLFASYFGLGGAARSKGRFGGTERCAQSLLEGEHRGLSGAAL